MISEDWGWCSAQKWWNNILAVNTWVITSLRYGKMVWKNGKREEWSKRIRRPENGWLTSITSTGRIDTNRIYLSRKKGGSGLISCQDCIEAAEKNSWRWYIKCVVEPLLKRRLCIWKGQKKPSQNLNSQSKDPEEILSILPRGWKAKATFKFFLFCTQVIDS